MFSLTSSCIGDINGCETKEEDRDGSHGDGHQTQTAYRCRDTDGLLYDSAGETQAPYSGT